MKPSGRAIQIERCFQDAWDEFGDEASTEFLIGITADRMGTDYGSVVDALAAVSQYEHRVEAQ